MINQAEDTPISVESSSVASERMERTVRRSNLTVTKIEIVTESQDDDAGSSEESPINDEEAADKDDGEADNDLKASLSEDEDVKEELKMHEYDGSRKESGEQLDTHGSHPYNPD